MTFFMPKYTGTFFLPRNHHCKKHHFLCIKIGINIESHRIRLLFLVKMLSQQHQILLLLLAVSGIASFNEVMFNNVGTTYPNTGFATFVTDIDLREVFTIFDTLHDQVMAYYHVNRSINIYETDFEGQHNLTHWDRYVIITIRRLYDEVGFLRQLFSEQQTTRNILSHLNMSPPSYPLT